jgi:SAM-dependent methyltransferase
MPRRERPSNHDGGRPPRRERPTRRERPAQGGSDGRGTRGGVDTRRPAAPTSWDPLATWYNGWVGEGGSEHHREVAVPATMRLLDPQRGESILDVGCGQGVLAPFVARTGARYLGVDASPRLLDLAKKVHAREGKFLLADARQLPGKRDLQEHAYDGVVFLLSLQDMDPLDQVLAGAAWALKPGGRLVLLLTHPSFRIPRQSGWGWDDGRKLVYRRIDRYLTPLPVPMNPPGGNGVVTRSFHRPISAYVNALGQQGLWVDRLEELPAHKLSVAGGTVKAVEHARTEIPLFLGIRARSSQGK